MRNIYIDEAGTSQHEPVTVVVGIVVHVDTQWLKTARDFVSLIDAFVPAPLREGFIFHAKTVYGGGRERDDWPLEQRMKLLKGAMMMPSFYNLGIAISAVRRTAKFGGQPDDMKLEDFQHYVAFGNCVGLADEIIREYGHRDEMATLVAEDIDNKREQLRHILNRLRVKPLEVDVHSSLKAGGRTTQIFKAERIIDTVHFVAKSRGSPHLQIADACAFGVRRYLAQQEDGENFMRWIYTKLLPDETRDAHFVGLTGGMKPIPPFAPPGTTSDETLQK